MECNLSHRHAQLHRRVLLCVQTQSQYRSSQGNIIFQILLFFFFSCHITLPLFWLLHSLMSFGTRLGIMHKRLVISIWFVQSRRKYPEIKADVLHSNLQLLQDFKPSVLENSQNNKICVNVQLLTD